MKVLLSTSVLILLSTQLLAADSQVTCPGPNNVPMPPPRCRVACQTEQILYSVCGNASRSIAGASHLLLHILVRGGDNLSVSVTDRLNETLEHECWVQAQPSGCNNSGLHVLHVKVLRGLTDYASAVVRVETQLRVWHYALLFIEAPSADENREWAMTLGYILEVAKPADPRGDWASGTEDAATIERLAAIVSRPSNRSRRFAEASVGVRLRGYNDPEIWEMTQQMSSCSGVWCAFEVKQLASSAQWQVVLAETLVQFNFILPGAYLKLYGQTSPQQLAIVDFKQWRRKASSVQQMKSPSTDAANCSPDPSKLSGNNGILRLSAITASVLLMALGMLTLTCWLVHRGGSSSSSSSSGSCSTGSSRVLVVAPPSGQWRHQLARLDSVRRHLRLHGCRLVIEEQLDVGRLRASLAESRVFILLSEDWDESTAEYGALDLQLLTMPEKSRYTVLRGQDVLEQLARRLDEFVTQQGSSDCPHSNAEEAAALVGNDIGHSV